MAIILKTQNLSALYSNKNTLSFDDVAIEKGQSALLLGPSGCGKTTLLSMMAGLLPPATGYVFHDGEDIYKMSSRVRDKRRGKHFGFIFQTLHLLAHLNVKNNIALAANMINAPIEKNRIENILESLGIGHKLNAMPHELSQGERQRVAIARAVLNRPDIIIADEPTSALDDHNAQITIDLIRHQARECGSTLILATHDNRILNGFDKVVKLEQSQKVLA